MKTIRVISLSELGNTYIEEQRNNYKKLNRLQMLQLKMGGINCVFSDKNMLPQYMIYSLNQREMELAHRYRAQKEEILFPLSQIGAIEGKDFKVEEY